MASDFLMALQGQGAYRKNSLTNLQVELPAVVIGGGLTAIDTATELQAYYITQVEKVVERYRAIEASHRRGFNMGAAGRGGIKNGSRLVGPRTNGACGARGGKGGGPRA